MKIHTSIRLIGARVRILDLAPLVTDMPQQVTARVLRHRRAEITGDAPVDQFAVRVAVTQTGNTANQLETTAILDFVEDAIELCPQPRQRKGCGFKGNAQAIPFCPDQRGIDFGDVGFIKAADPGGIALDFRTDPGIWAPDQRAWSDYRALLFRRSWRPAPRL